MISRLLLCSLATAFAVLADNATARSFDAPSANRALPTSPSRPTSFRECEALERRFAAVLQELRAAHAQCLRRATSEAPSGSAGSESRCRSLQSAVEAASEKSYRESGRCRSRVGSHLDRRRQQDERARRRKEDDRRSEAAAKREAEHAARQRAELEARNAALEREAVAKIHAERTRAANDRDRQEHEAAQARRHEEDKRRDAAEARSAALEREAAAKLHAERTRAANDRDRKEHEAAQARRHEEDRRRSAAEDAARRHSAAAKADAGRKRKH
jgi:hypothetical protein